MDNIAQESGLSKATLYLYFASKEDLIVAILQAFFESGFTELRTLIASDRAVSTSLLVWTRQRMQEMRELAAFLNIGFEFYAIAAHQQSTRQVVCDFYHQYRTAIAVLLQKGIEQGEFHAIDVHEMAIAIVSMYEGMTLLWMLDPCGFDLVGVAERAVQALVGSIAKAA